MAHAHGELQVPTSMSPISMPPSQVVNASRHSVQKAPCCHPNQACSACSARIKQWPSLKMDPYGPSRSSTPTSLHLFGGRATTIEQSLLCSNCLVVIPADGSGPLSCTTVPGSCLLGSSSRTVAPSHRVCLSRIPNADSAPAPIKSTLWLPQGRCRSAESGLATGSELRSRGFAPRQDSCRLP